MKLAVAIGLLAIAAPRAAVACASCGCGDATLTAAGLEKPYRNRLRLVFDNRYGEFSLGDSTAGEHTWFWRSSLGISWTPHPRVSVLALVPWVSSWIKPVSAPRQFVSGLGDMEFSARLLMFREQGFSPHHLLWAMAGLKTPTGYRVKDDGGYPYSDDDQPGSGSWDPFAAITYAWYSGHIMSAFVSTSYRQTTPGWHDYRRGASLGGSAAIQAQPWSWVAFALGVDLIWQQADVLPNKVASPNTGGFVGYVAPAILVSPATDWLIRVVVDAPAVTAMYGQQNIGTQVALSIAYDAH